MSQASQGDVREALRRALTELERRRHQIEQLRRREEEPIAIVGAGCRFPGGEEGPDSFWKLLDEGGEAIGQVPPERWDAGAYYDPDPAAPGKMATQRAGFLSDVERFDAAFFGISPRETRSLDPQQRLLLEVCWEALEDARIPPDALYGTPTGVFVGITCFDHALMLGADAANFDTYAGTGSALNMAAGRLSYVLGLIGPCMAVDTACSSSLVALHLACQSLRLRECDQALVGGVNLILSPEVMVSFSQARMLAPDGRCKTFAAEADGYVRGEGCGALVLRRLADARRAGDPVWGLVRGSAVNQDGQSGGLTVPSGAAQQRVVEQALAQAGVEPEQVDYVEAHGTGTALGDPIEIDALNAVFGRRQRPLWVGSAKTNVGHLESGAGVVGMVKVLLALRHQRLPAHLHCQRLNPHVPWEEIPLEVVRQQEPWPRGERPRLAGVSSFGFSGINAHVIVEEAPAEAESAPPERGRALQVLPLSARDPEALAQLQRRLVRRLRAAGEGEWPAICRTAGTGRSHFPHRLAVVAAGAAAAVEQLEAEVSAADRVRSPARPSAAPPLAMLCTGQGAQCAGMGGHFYESEPVFREAVDRGAEALEGTCDWSLVESLCAEDMAEEALRDTARAQPLLFAYECALAALWKSWGVQPDWVLGHSVGELAAASIAGVFNLEDGVRLAAARGRLMGALPAGGGMVAVLGPAERVEQALAGGSGDLVIAAYNGPRNTVVSGSLAALEELAAQLRESGCQCRALEVSHAFHSPLMEPMLEAFGQAAGEVAYARPQVPLVSCVSGAVVDREVAGADYWVRHVLQPVRFERGMAVLASAGAEVFLEVGPQPVLLGMGRGCLGERQEDLWLASARGGERVVERALASLYVRGVDIDWGGVCGPGPGADLPTYPFSRQHFPLGRKTAQPRQLGTAQEVALLERLRTSGRFDEEQLAIAAAALAGVDEDGDPVDQWFYQMEWERLEPSLQPAWEGGDWLLVGGTDDFARQAIAFLNERGQRCDWARPGPVWEEVGEGTYGLDLGQLEQVERLWRVLEERGRRLCNILYLSAAVAPGVLETAAADGLGLLHVVRTAAGAGGGPGRVWVVTRGAAPAGDELLEDCGLAQASTWGLARSIGLEHPEVWGGLVDLDPRSGCVEQLLATVAAADGEEPCAWRGEKRYGLRLDRWRPGSEKWLPKAAGTYLITGGLGALGLRLAQWLVGTGARALLLTGRRAQIAGEAAAVLERLRATGARVEVRRADAADAAAMAGVLAECGAELPPLCGLFHAAGVVGYEPLEQIDAAGLKNVLQPKVEGAWVLHQLTAERELDCFVSFSSVASVWGSKSQAHYGAANAFLDALAHYRRGRGLPATTLNWGPWGEGGMTSAEAETLLRRVGVPALAPGPALEGLARALAQAPVQAVIADVDWPLFRVSYEMRGESGLLTRLERAPEVAPEVRGTWAVELEGLPAAERWAHLVDAVGRETALVLGWEEERCPDAEQGFFELGMDSLMALEFKGRLEAAAGRGLPATLIFDRPTAAQVADYLIEVLELAGGEQEEEEAADDRVDELAQLTEAEAEARLLEKLDDL